MAENRQHGRVSYIAVGTLKYRNATFDCRLENISMSGALVSIRNTTATDFRPGNICLLNLYDELECRQISIEVLVAHHAFAYAGLRFLSLDVDTQVSLEAIMERAHAGIDGCTPHKSSIHLSTSTEN